MNLRRNLAAGLLMVAVAAPASAGDLQGGIARAASAQAEVTQPNRTRMPAAVLGPGLTLFVGGMAVATYGYLHTSDGEFVEAGDIGRVSKPKLAASGLALAAAGGALLFWGNHRLKHAPSVLVGPGRAELTQRISW